MSEINAVSVVDIAISAMQAQTRQIAVTMNNMANAQTTDRGDGTPYRRMVLKMTAAEGNLTGVNAGDPVADMSTDFQRVLMAGHPQADKDGYVLMPNIKLPQEMMNMVNATRAYEASAAVLKRFQSISDITLELLR